MRYLLGSGYIGGPGREEFAELWVRNTIHHIRPDPTRVVVVSVGNSKVPLCMIGKWMNILDLDGNCGHIHHLLTGSKPHWLGGWSASILALALIAYNDESDLIYKEQDCLCFGPWVERMYFDLGDADMVFGYKHKSEPHMPCSQSLFLIRHRFLLDFVTRYISLGTDNNPDNLPESKFEKLEQADPGHYRRLSFGVDRERPLPLDQDVFYCQQLRHEDLAALREKGMI